MAKWSLVVFSALLGCTIAEPPSGYSYAPASSYIVVGGGHGSSHGSSLSSGGHYTSVPVGHQTSEGYHIDPHLLEKIKHIILKDEIHNQAYQSSISAHGSHGGHGISSHYGPPAPVYGVPHDNIVGIELGHIQQGIQVAQYHQADEGYDSGYAGGYSHGYSSGGYSSGGYSSGGHSGGDFSGHGASISYSAPSVSYSAPSVSYSAPSVSYSAPSHSYNTIGVPSGSYGVPSPSSSYGAPHH